MRLKLSSGRRSATNGAARYRSSRRGGPSSAGSGTTQPGATTDLELTGPHLTQDQKVEGVRMEGG
eukprot:6034209-Pyramimonas_sp.AAC.1